MRQLWENYRWPLGIILGCTGLIAVVLLWPDHPRRTRVTRIATAEQAVTIKPVLNPRLEKQLQEKVRGVFRYRDSSGTLPDGTRWSYRQVAPRSRTSALSNGEGGAQVIRHDEPASAFLTLRARSGSPVRIQTWLRQLLSDPQLQVRAVRPRGAMPVGILVSRRLVAQPFSLSGNQVDIRGIYDIALCPVDQRVRTPLVQACTATLRLEKGETRSGKPAAVR